MAGIKILLDAHMHVAFAGITNCLPRRKRRLEVLADMVDYSLGLEMRVEMHPRCDLQRLVSRPHVPCNTLRHID